MITGTYNVPATLASQPILQELYLECDTSAPVTINLFEIADVQRQWDLVIYVSDATNNAGLFPITINCGAGNHFDQLGVNTLTLNVDGSAVELRIVSDTAWLASKGSSGSGGGGITDVTYSQLYNLITTKGLTEGAKYRLLDYQSVNFLNGIATAENNPIPTNPNFNPREVYTSPVQEKIILTAISDYQLDPVGISETYGDIVEFQGFTNTIGVSFQIYNGNNLPDSTPITGFDLQWDGTNVFLTMPASYPALFGHNFYVYAEFFNGVNYYYLDEEIIALSPFLNLPDFDYNGTNSYLTTVDANDQIKIIFPDLTLTDFNNYVASTLYVNTDYSLAPAYGYVTKRTDPVTNITAPFDFRHYLYRRFQVNLQPVFSYAPIGYYGIGDNFYSQGTTGNFRDYSVFGNYAQNIQISGTSSIGRNWASMDNCVCLDGSGNIVADNIYLVNNTFYYFGGNNLNNSNLQNNVFYNGLYNSTIETSFNNNIIGGVSESTIGHNSYNNKIDTINRSSLGSLFASNVMRDITDSHIKNNFSNNYITTIYRCNIENDFTNNTFNGVSLETSNIGNNFSGNNGTNIFRDNTVGDSFVANTMVTFTNNYIGSRFNSNTMGNVQSCIFGDDCFGNNLGTSFSDNIAGDDFYGNTFVGNSNQQNVFGNNFNQNTASTFFFRNTFKNNTYLNTFGLIFAQNNFLESCFSNTIGNGFSTNTFLNRFENNTIGGNFIGNTANDTFVGNTFGDACSNNEFNDDFGGNLIVNNFSEVKVVTSISGINFSAATLVYQLGNKTIFLRSDNTARLSYVNAADTVVYNTITA